MFWSFISILKNDFHIFACSLTVCHTEYCQELEIQRLSAEIESLKNPQNHASSARLDELQEENARLKYRINILKRVSDTAGEHRSAEQRQVWGPTQALQKVTVVQLLLSTICFSLFLLFGVVCPQGLQEESAHSDQFKMKVNQWLQELFGKAIRAVCPKLEKPPLAVVPDQQAELGDQQCSLVLAQVILKLYSPGLPLLKGPCDVNLVLRVHSE